MELVVKGIKLKAAANLPFKYKAHFRRDFFNDILRLAKKFNKKEENTKNLDKKEKNIKNFNKKKKHIDEITGADIEIMYNIFWTCAKIADDSIPEKEEFFGLQENLTVTDIFENISRLLEATFYTEKK
jgi:hypothetical protein